MKLVDENYYLYTDGETPELKLTRYLGPLEIPDDLAGYGFEDDEDGPVHVFGSNNDQLFDVALFTDELEDHIIELSPLDEFLLGVNNDR